MKKTLHIISHTHWDREWYMSFESHRMRLVDLMDSLIEKMENDDDYKFFHLDGQTIVIEDYLEIKPQMRQRLYALIKAGRIQVGPWYVLQDEFLTSGESNVRNMMEGLRFCRENEIEPVMSGYMPDAFGNISQMPQILNGFGIDNAIFGRGLWPIFFNNRVETDKKPFDKELLWCGSDGTEIIGLMFGDWYNNANEMPCNDESEISERYNRIVNWLSITAKTPHLLGMNGSDHQPIQVDLPKSIKAANELLGENIEIKHSNFKDLISLIRPYKDKFSKVYGELTSQLTSGNCRLVDTASTHVPLKQQNHEVQNLLTFKSEPASSYASLFGDKYREEMLRYAWKTLMQCHPHDSICTCSCDAVAKEMSVRFDKAYDTANYVLNEALDFISNNVCTSNSDDINIVVFHSSPLENSDIINTYFYSDELLDEKELWLADSNDVSVPCEIRYIGNKFSYTLPKNSFRKVKYSHCYELSFPVKLCGLGCFLFKVKKGKPKNEDKLFEIFENGAENKTIKFTINSDGTLNVTDKATGITYTNVLQYEDTGDCGDSYNYIQTIDRNAIFPKEKVCINLVKSNRFSATFEIVSEIDIPSNISDNKQRSSDLISHKIKTLVTLSAGINRIDIKTSITNASENHRLRVLFPTNINSDYVMADGQFDVVKRNIKPWDGWKNSSNTQRMQAFFAVENSNNGFLVASKGLNEYEVLRDGKNTMALTLLRAIGEIGDWGEFPTPSMQLKKDLSFEYSIIPYTYSSKSRAFNDAYTFAGDFFCSKQTGSHGGKIKPNMPIIKVFGENIVYSALKMSENEKGYILRIYNISESQQDVKIEFKSDLFTKICETNLGEETQNSLNPCNDFLTISIPAKKIKSFLLS